LDEILQKFLIPICSTTSSSNNQGVQQTLNAQYAAKPMDNMNLSSRHAQFQFQVQVFFLFSKTISRFSFL